MDEQTKYGAPSRSLQDLARELVETHCGIAEENGDRRTIW